ncbi:hypothetical protein EON66_03440 [archaeon]|nr:MAG: hypothetical protein EON66_03440 [archaeon]
MYTNIPLGGPLGGNLLRQDWIRVLSYVGMWLVVMVAKALFDIQVQIQAVRASQTVQSITIPYAWGFLGSGTENVWISIGMVAA